MFFNADQTKGAVSSVVPENPAHTPGPGSQDKLHPQQFPGKGTPVEAEGAAGAGEAAAGAGAAEGLADLLPLAALAL